MPFRTLLATLAALALFFVLQAAAGYVLGLALLATGIVNGAELVAGEAHAYIAVSAAALIATTIAFAFTLIAIDPVAPAIARLWRKLVGAVDAHARLQWDLRPAVASLRDECHQRPSG